MSSRALVSDIKSMGPTLISILGAMGPVTAIVVGIAVFSEPLTYGIGMGVGLIIAAVVLIILKQ